jgi:hypothetical protein
VWVNSLEERNAARHITAMTCHHIQPTSPALKIVADAGRGTLQLVVE